MNTRRAFTLTEVVITCVIIAVAFLALLELNSSSNQAYMDAYYEFLAFQLAREPLEVFRAFGYQWLVHYSEHELLPNYPVGQWVDLKMIKESLPRYFPQEVGFFKREISLVHLDNVTPRAVKVKVVVAPTEGSKIDRWLKRDRIELEGLIVEQPYEVTQ
jgi:prepilin-type N-terminal cleavage/methylation domain-containing protein